MKKKQTECYETSAYKIQTPGNYLEGNIQHTKHGESLKITNDKGSYLYESVALYPRKGSIVDLGCRAGK
jgi:hypothetical protein